MPTSLLLGGGIKRPILVHPWLPRTTVRQIDDQTTATTETWANPDGTLTSQIAGGPVRYDAGDGNWQDVNTTLQPNGDGSFSPTAFGQNIVLSGGGGQDGQTQDLLTVGSGKTAITWQWKGALPTPTVKGNAAAYAGIEPGIDLVIEVRPTGVEQYFVLHSRPATVPSFVFPLRLGAGVTASTANDGDVAFTADDGTVLARTPAASMWSASATGDVTVPTATPQSVPVTLDTSSATPSLDVSPSASALQDSNTQYPVVVDPGINLSSTYDTWVNAGSTGFSGGSATTDSTGPLSSNATRTFLNWNDSAITGTDVTAATLNLYNNSADSPANTWQIWRTGMYYAFNGDAVTASGSGTCTSTCTNALTLYPPAGWDTLRVWAMDEAGNVSSASTPYSFGADPVVPVGLLFSSAYRLAGTCPLTS